MLMLLMPNQPCNAFNEGLNVALQENTIITKPIQQYNKKEQNHKTNYKTTKSQSLINIRTWLEDIY
jgi:hypothetical protein